MKTKVNQLLKEKFLKEFTQAKVNENKTTKYSNTNKPLYNMWNNKCDFIGLCQN